MDESDNQKFCLKWNNFQNNFMSQFEALKEDEDFVDVTLSCYGHSIKAHKVVLSACSPYLKNIFKEHPCKHPVIILDNLSFKNLEAVIQFVYTGQVYVEQTELTSFLKAAETLQIRGLSESSTTHSLMEPVLPVDPLSGFSFPLSGNVKAPKKREAEDESELKKPVNKKISKKNLTSCTKESDEPSKGKDKDCTNDNDNKSESPENSSLDYIPEREYSSENEDKRLALSTRNEESNAGEQKKPHWLDPRSCPMCNRVYSNLSNLRQHMKLIHNPTLVTCKLCYKTFKTDLYLRRHLISFHEINANATGVVTLEPYKPVQNQTLTWNHNIKPEPDAFNEIFNENEMYQVPE